MKSFCDSPRVQTWSRLPGTVWRGLIVFYDRPSTLSSNAPAFWGQSRLSGFCCANRLCVRSPCHHNSRMRTFDKKQLCDINYEPKVAILSPDPTCLVGSPGEVPASVHTMGLPGKVPLSGTFPGKQDLVWTQGKCYLILAGKEDIRHLWSYEWHCTFYVHFWICLPGCTFLYMYFYRLCTFCSIFIDFQIVLIMT